MNQRKHYLFTAGDFPSKKQLQQAQKWVEEFRAILEAGGCAAEFFSPWHSKIQKGDTIHFFGLTQLENWARVKQRSCKVIVYSLPDQIDYPQTNYPARWKIWLQSIRKYFIKSSLDYQSIFDSVDQFFVSEEKKRELLRFVAAKKIYSLSESAEESAALFLKTKT
jgi:hypothetical protein